MLVIFGRNRKDKLSNLLAKLGGSQWSHCAIIDRDGVTVIESIIPAGVVKTHIADFKARYTDTYIAQVPVKNSLDAYKLAKAQIGKPYDFRALFSMLGSREWEDPSAWVCSELVAHCMGIFRPEKISKVTVEHIWMVSNDIG